MESRIRKCKKCGREFKQFNSLQNVCGAKCAKELKDEKKAAKKDTPKTDRQILILKAQAAFNAFIRERDKGQPCICCGKPLGVNYHCGHFYSSGGHSNVRFNEDNAHGQRAECNTTHRAGMLGEYSERLEKKIGAAAFEVLRADAYEPKKWEVRELEGIIKEYKQKLKELQEERKEIKND